MNDGPKLRHPAIAPLVTGRLAWIHHTQGAGQTVDALVEHVRSYVVGDQDSWRTMVSETIIDLLDLDLVEAGAPVYGEPVWSIAADPVGDPDEPGAWRAAARRAADDLVARCDPEPPDCNPTVVLREDVALLYDAVRVLDLLDRAANR